MQPALQPVQQPVQQPAMQPAMQPTLQPTVRPVVPPVVPPVAPPAVRPTVPRAVAPAVQPKVPIATAKPSSPAAAPAQVRLAEGQSVRCNGSKDGKIYRYTGGQLRHYPNPAIASSWDKNWGKPVSVDCRGIPIGAPMALKPVTIVKAPTPVPVLASRPATRPTEGQAIRCDGSKDGKVYRYTNAQIRHYPSPPIAASWDKTWSKPSTVDCKGIPVGAPMALKPANAAPVATPVITAAAAGRPAEGQAVKCNGDKSGKIYRMTGGQLRHYPNPAIASSWDKNWGKPAMVECKGIPIGTPMALKPASAAVAPVAAPTQSPMPASGWTPVSGTLSNIAIDGRLVVGVNAQGNVYWAEVGKSNWAKVSGTLKQITISGNRVYGTQTGSKIFRADDIKKPSWILVPGGLEQVSMSGDLVCGVNSGGNIYTGTYNNKGWAKQEGTLTNVAVDRGRACGVNAKGNIYFADNALKPVWKQVDGGLKQVSMSGNLVCGISASGSIYYGTYMKGDWKPLPGKAKSIAVSGTTVYCVGLKGEIFYRDLPASAAPAVAPSVPVAATARPAEGQAVKCNGDKSGKIYRMTGGQLRHYPDPAIASSWDKNWGKPAMVECKGIPIGTPMALKPASTAAAPVAAPIKAPAPASGWTPLSGVLSNIAIDGRMVVGVNPQGNVYWAEVGKSNWAQVSGTLKQITISGNRAYGIQAGSKIFRADDIKKPSWILVPGGLEQVSMSGDLVCGVNSGGNIYTGTYNTKGWAKQEGTLTNVAVDRGRACGVNAKGNIYFADNALKPAWKQVAGGLKQVSMSGNLVCGINAGGNIYYGTYMKGDWKPLPARPKASPSAGQLSIALVSKARSSIAIFRRLPLQQSRPLRPSLPQHDRLRARPSSVMATTAAKSTA